MYSEISEFAPHKKNKKFINIGEITLQRSI